MKRPFKREPGIYLITNTVNGKVWVGQGAGREGIQGRITNHLSKFRGGINSQHLQSAWNKYGPDTFVFEVLLHCPVEQCDYWEDYFIEMLQSWRRGKGYNLDRSARGSGGPRTQAVIDKIRQANAPHKDRVMKLLTSPEARAKATATRNRTCANPAWRKALSDKLLEVYKDPEKRRQRATSAKEVQNRPEVKCKLHEIKSGRVWCNNGCESKFVRPENIPDGWVRGSLTDKATCRGRKYFTNPSTGEIRRLLYAPEGWVPGRGLRH